ncbi:PREDICTED: phosphoglycerate mutase-like protein 1 [Tarenaya hassleriana]|uniref:phosphoglycerate mutase-like protein 1 n=1 Tax=Tarenaya hassleriana TaxID=28532 RepID=UPI00053C980C|nr:PREDICTED: phosphoglycerate mutase-like protein 1 [Tarenaya hassleriana]
MQINKQMAGVTSGRYKVIHLVRHAEGIHNVEVDKNKKALFSPSLSDAQLSPLGWKQVTERRREVHESGLLKRIELVVTSPMQRTIQTATGIFGKEHKSKHNISSPTSIANYPPIIAFELCREQLGMYPCNRRGSVSKYIPKFPEIDFSLIESEEDQMWQADAMEKVEQVAARGMQFLKWLWEREENEIAVVSHGIFLQETLLAFADNLDPSVKSKLCKRFLNCELRSVIIYESEKESDKIGYAADLSKEAP